MAAFQYAGNQATDQSLHVPYELI